MKYTILSTFNRALMTASAAGCLLYLTACSIGSPSEPATETPTTITPPPVVSKNYFPVRNCINLGSALEGENEGDFGYTVRQSDFVNIANAGFDTVRLPIRWDSHASTVSPYTIDAAWLDRIEEIVGLANDAGLGAIVDSHAFFPLTEDLAANKERFLGMWEQIAERFSGAPDNVYFEPFNEPENFDDMASVNDLYAELIPLIRESNPTRPIILGGNEYSTIDTIGDVVWPDDDYLVATFHDYEPFDFTHQGAQWVEFPPALGRSWGDGEDQTNLDFIYDTAAAFKVDNPDLPVVVGEYGAINQATLADRIAWMSARRTRMEEEEIGSCIWNYIGDMGLYDLDTESWIDGVLGAVVIEQ